MKLRRRVKRWWFNGKRRVVDSWLLRGRRRPTAEGLIIETTNRCTLACSCCPNGVAPRERLRSRGIMTLDTFRRVVDNIDVGDVRECFLHMCGEPFLNPDLPAMARELRERGITPVVYSNGYDISLPLLEELIGVKGVKIAFSMDLIDRGTYERIRRPGQWERAIESLRGINEVMARNRRFYGLNIIVCAENVSSAEDVSGHLFEEFSNLNHIAFTSEWPWPGLKETGDIVGHISPRVGQCSRCRGALTVLWDGRVSFCNLDYAGDMIVGSILDTPYSQLYNNATSRRFRRKLWSGCRKSLPLCNRCLLGRYDSVSLTLYRNRLRKTTREEAAEIFRPLTRYFDAPL